jgi:hypothetical protein
LKLSVLTGLLIFALVGGAVAAGPFPVDISVRKFADSNLNGVQDAGEADIVGWAVDVTDPLGVTNTVYTPTLIVAATPGTYTFVEETPSSTLQTVSILDGVTQSLYPTADPTVLVDVQGDLGETHEVVYGNSLGTPTATPTSTPTATPSATPTLVQIGGSCEDSSQCETGILCIENICTDFATPVPAASNRGLLIALALLAGIGGFAISLRKGEGGM